jgi:uncharacterized membrane protein
MHELLEFGARHLATLLEALALIVIAIGAFEAALNIARMAWGRHASNADKRAVWLDFARWLSAALTFQLAADIVQTTIAPTWDQIGRMAALAAVRTFLTFFLDRDMEAIRRLQQESARRQGDE